MNNNQERSEGEVVFDFEMKVVLRRTDPWYYTNWDNAMPVTVRAANRAEAFKQVWAVMGPAPDRRTWTAKIKRIASVAASSGGGS